MKHSHSFLTIGYLKHETLFQGYDLAKTNCGLDNCLFIKETFLVVYVKSFSHSFFVFACFFLLILGDHGNVNAKFLDMIETK